MRAIARKIFTAILNRLASRSYVLDLAQNDIVALSEVTAHLMNARATLYRAVRDAMQGGVPLFIDTSDQHIRLSNGHTLNYCFSERDLSTIGVKLVAWVRSFIHARYADESKRTKRTPK